MTDAKPNADPRVMRDLERINRNVARERALLAKPLRTIRVEDISAEVHESADRAIASFCRGIDRSDVEVVVLAHPTGIRTKLQDVARDAAGENRVQVDIHDASVDRLQAKPNAFGGPNALKRSDGDHVRIFRVLNVGRQLQRGGGPRIDVGGVKLRHRIVSSAAEWARRTVAGLARFFNRGA